jgi:membrane fusion protein (multidrug efflux system)
VTKTKSSKILVGLLALGVIALPACNKHEGEGEQEHHNVVVTNPKIKDVIITQQYVCQIRAKQCIKVRALANGYIDKIHVNEGQRVKKDEVMFKIRPILYQRKLEAEKAEAKLAELELAYTKSLNQDKVVSENEVALYQAKLEKAKAKADLAEADLQFTSVKAPFDGIIDRQEEQLGSLIKEGDVLTTLSDNSTMWVYFNVPEARYLEYMARAGKKQRKGKQQILKLVDSDIELKLAHGKRYEYSDDKDGKKFKYSAEGRNVVTIEGKFNNETGNIAFRADFPNPDHLLRHGQTGTVLIKRNVKNALVIPQRATFEVLDKMYVYVMGEDHVVRQREIVIDHELPDVFVLKKYEITIDKGRTHEKGIKETEKIVLEGGRQLRDGQHIEEYEFRRPEEVLTSKYLKHKAE